MIANSSRFATEYYTIRTHELHVLCPDEGYRVKLPPRNSTGRVAVAGVVFAIVFGAQLALVAVVATDIPFHDPWNIDGQWLYPSWLDGTLRLWDLAKPIGEHRIAATNLLNLSLFVANGQWDPLVALVALSFLRASCAAAFAVMLGAGFSFQGRCVAAAAAAVAFFPHLAWQTVLWAVHDTDFAIAFSWLALGLLGASEFSYRRWIAGVLAGIAAIFSQGAGELVPVALTGLCVVRWQDGSFGSRVPWRHIVPIVILFVLVGFVHTEGTKEEGLKSTSAVEFVVATARALSWPHTASPWAFIVMNMPLGALVVARMLKRRRAVLGEDFLLLAAGWSIGIALAIGWARGGDPELLFGVPSRYVDFMVALPLVNGWAAAVLAREAAPAWRRRGYVLGLCWAAFFAVGWLGLSVEVMTRLIIPRARDREAPARLARAFQLTRDPTVFTGQPRLLIPHPDLASVQAVLDDPRMRGHLPPSLQPDMPMGRLSRLVRALLGRSVPVPTLPPHERQ